MELYEIIRDWLDGTTNLRSKYKVSKIDDEYYLVLIRWSALTTNSVFHQKSHTYMTILYKITDKFIPQNDKYPKLDVADPDFFLNLVYVLTQGYWD